MKAKSHLQRMIFFLQTCLLFDKKISPYAVDITKSNEDMVENAHILCTLQHIRATTAAEWFVDVYFFSNTHSGMALTKWLPGFDEKSLAFEVLLAKLEKYKVLK